MSSNNQSADGAHENPYGYVPSRATAVIFILLFATSTLLHAFQATKHRLWWFFWTACFCGIIELVGWSGRLWSSFNPLNGSAFQMQITCTIIAPTPLLAANFVILGNVIKRLGPAFSRLTPRRYTIFFTSSDVISLVVQALGGGIAASSNDNAGSKLGSNIMLVGIIFQLVIILVYSAFSIEFYYRYNTNRPFEGRPTSDGILGSAQGRLTPNIKLMSYVLAFSTVLFFIRSIYRIAELADGWDGRIIQTQVYFNVLDGAMIILAIYTLNIFHPGRLLYSYEETKEAELRHINSA
ncbi:hypothetical protein JR316_0009041 [Psilocybe cubensis]|uniref:Uncharacterized protein n=2 Tax=Psilocybe cubensis TaxID=181762 RepID=A0ACB8GSM8_PSICU|nr:hypothetical protein JR316_0009041 [Psilocybe cubensis]KAH9478584.1 hypothetical protein JR316_0009041 [Psilocybe cubensis]